MDLLAFSLERAGFEILAAYDAPAAMSLVKSHGPDLIVLDINLGAWNGLEVLRLARR